MATPTAVEIELPESSIFKYIGEGAANIVYKVTFARDATPPHSDEGFEEVTRPPSHVQLFRMPSWSFQGAVLCRSDKLVRFRKDLPTTVPCVTAQENWESVIKPLFPADQIVDQTLVGIPARGEDIPLHMLPPGILPRGMIPTLNALLRQWDHGLLAPDSNIFPTGYRLPKRRGTYLADDRHALLITDMTAKPDDLGVYQFKPKWLAQSPSAPKNSKRCRQCAHMARINAEHARKGEEPRRFFCPLYFSAQDHGVICQNISSLILAPGTDFVKIDRLAKWVQSTDLLNTLRDRQVTLDTVGVLEGDANDNNLLAAMTLRDCTVYVRADDNDPEEWEARIGDLDLKSPQKIHYWRRIERELIDEGWYEGREKEEDKQPIICRLHAG